MFVDSSVPDTYDRIALISDNYFVLVRETTLNSGVDYDAYIQYIKPSTLLIHTNKYRINKGTSYDLDVIYTNNQYYNYIDSIDYSYSVQTMPVDNVKSDFWSRSDCFEILGTSVIILCFILYMLNAVTSLVEKGGVFRV